VPNNRERLIVELGFRKIIARNGGDTMAKSGRYQGQIHKHAFRRVDRFGRYLEGDSFGYGARPEIRVKF
jgi:hypothetical protein